MLHEHTEGTATIAGVPKKLKLFCDAVQCMAEKREQFLYKCVFVWVFWGDIVFSVQDEYQGRFRQARCFVVVANDPFSAR